MSTDDPVQGPSSTTAEWPTGPVQARPMIGSIVGDRCATCGAPLASDQRYCVQCGERRGKARFPVTAPSPAPANAQAAAPAQPPEQRQRRVPSGATLVAGIATLLLAMGVGVEIGRSGSNNASNQRASQPAVQVVTVAGGGGSAAAATTPTTATHTAAATASKKGAKTTTAAANAPISKKVVVKAAAAASQVLGGAAPSQPTIKQGQKCTGGSSSGCSGGKFTGSFFGP